MKKLCYIIPEYDPKSHTHFAYLADFADELKKHFNLRIIEEKRHRIFLPFRLLFARLAGYRDFYIHYSFAAAFLASLMVKILGGRTFYWNAGLPWQYRRNFLRESFERLVYKMITFLVTGTEGLKKEYAGHYNLPLEKIKVMPNWINLEKIKNQKSKIKINELRKNLNINGGPKILLFVHRLSKRKGAHYLPEILNKLSDAKDFVLIVIGDGPERETLESNVKCQMSNVKLLGWVPNDQLLNYYSLADVFIMPSEEEGFPHVLLEAMAAGVPFVAFDVGGTKEISSPELHPYIVQSGDIAAFVQKIKELLAMDQQGQEAFKRREREWVRRFDIKVVVDTFKKMLV